MTPVVLKWDSDFFGFPVARTDWSGNLSEIAEAIADARKIDVTLLYVFAPPNAAPPASILNNVISVFTCQRVELEKGLTDAPNLREERESIVALTEINCNLNEISELGVIAGSYSRFMCDTMIPRSIGRQLFRIWAENSFRGILADVNYGYFKDGRIMGFISVRAQKDHGRIVLIAVRPEARRQGIGSRLLRVAESYVAKSGGVKIITATQGHNDMALRLYHSAGYKEVTRSQVWHVWLKPPSWNTMA